MLLGLISSLKITLVLIDGDRKNLFRKQFRNSLKYAVGRAAAGHRGIYRLVCCTSLITLTLHIAVAFCNAFLGTPLNIVHMAYTNETVPLVSTLYPFSF